jgi:hypothetical protein
MRRRRRFGWAPRRPLREEPFYRLPKRVLNDAAAYFILALIFLSLPFIMLDRMMALVVWLKEHVPEPVAMAVVIAGLVAVFVRRR